MKDHLNNLDVEIGSKDGKGWDAHKLAKVKQFALEQDALRSSEQKIKNNLRSIEYQMYDYLNDPEISETEVRSLQSFLKAFLQPLQLSARKFAQYIDMTDGNLAKYLNGARKFNIDLAMKFAHFFHTSPDLWLNVQTKNDLIALQNEKKQKNTYKKYDYIKALELNEPTSKYDKGKKKANPHNMKTPTIQKATKKKRG